VGFKTKVKEERRAAAAQAEEIPEWKVAAIERRTKEAATAVEVKGKVKKNNAERTQAAAEWAVAEAEAKVVIAAVDEAPKGEVQYDDIVKFHEAMGILMGGPEEAARRAELKTVTVTRFDEKAYRDRIKKREEAEWLRKTEPEKAKAIKQQKKEKKKEKDLKKNRKQFSLK
jgi:hypothetical protein